MIKIKHQTQQYKNLGNNKKEDKLFAQTIFTPV